MKIKRLLLLVGIVLLFSVCFLYMNKHFDRLSRYPYENEESRAIIDQYLNDDEIEYIIEYSIAPYEFIEYIQSPVFNIYHIDIYNKFSDLLYYLGPNEIVDFSEEVIRLNKVEEAYKLLPEYYYSDILFWLNNGDVYNPGSTIIPNPNALDAKVDETHTITNRTPFPLVEVDFIASRLDKIVIREEAYEPLKIMCDDMDHAINSRSCGYLRVERAFVSYDDQEELYLSDSENPCDCDLPGHSEHQLGLALDLYAPYAPDFSDTYAYSWLSEHANEYGFNFTYGENRIGHIRYIGTDVTTLMQMEEETK